MAWPGQYQGYNVPPTAFMSSMQRQPMYGEYAGPRYTGPVNLGAMGASPELGMMAQLAMPSILSMVMGNEMTPMQFSPEQSAYDQLVANQYYRQQQSAIAQSSRRDQHKMGETLRGVIESTTKEKLTPVQEARNDRFVEGLESIMPMALQMLGPDLVDQMYGSTGSSKVMAQQLHQAFRTQLDPVTGQRGFSGESTAAATNEIFESLYGENANPAAMRGISAGQAGSLAHELQQRGLLGPMAGAIPLEERIANLPEQLSEGQVSRIAERVPSQNDGRSLQQLRDANEEITQEMIDSVKERVRESLRQMKGTAPAISDQELKELFSLEDDEQVTARRQQLGRGLTAVERQQLAEDISLDEDGTSIRRIRLEGGAVTPAQEQTAATRVEQLESRAQQDLTLQEIEKMPGGEDVLRAADAQRIAGRIKNLSGAVSAMREIFGDMGNPNAPMQQLVNGLEALTQGGLATMTAQQVEGIVRESQAITNQTGLGLQGQLGLLGQNAQLADRLGIDRQFAFRAVSQSSMFGKALEETQRLDMPAWGARSREHMVLADQQLRMHSAASPLANQLGAVMRMRDRGLLEGMDDNSELAALTKAVEQRELTYTFQDPETGEQRTKSVSMNRARLGDILERDAGITPTELWSAISDRPANQEMVMQYDIDDLARRRQTNERALHMFAPAIAGRIGGTMRDKEVDQDLRDAGVTANEGDFRELIQEVGTGVAVDYFHKLESEEVRDPEKRQQALGQVFRERVREAIQRRLPEADAETIEQLTHQTMEQMGGDLGMARMGSTIFDTIDQVSARNPVLQSAVTAYELLSPRTAEARMRNTALLEGEKITRQALGGMATAQPLARIVDAFAAADETTTTQEILGKALGGVDMRELAARDPGGQVAVMLGLLDETRALDPSNPKQLRMMEAKARRIRALVEGGETAQKVLAEIERDRPRITAEEATKEEQDEAIAAWKAYEASTGRLADMDAEVARGAVRNQQIAKNLSAVDADPATRRAQQWSASKFIEAGISDFGNIELDENRKLTAAGLVTTDDEGKVTSTRAYTDPEVAKLALGELQKKQKIREQEVDQAKEKIANLTREEELDLAERGGFVRGAPAIHPAELKAIQEAAAGEGTDTVRQKLKEAKFTDMPTDEELKQQAEAPTAAEAAADRAAAAALAIPGDGDQATAAMLKDVKETRTDVADIAGSKPAGEQKLLVKITGTLEEKIDGTIHLAGDGAAHTEHVFGRLG